MPHCDRKIAYAAKAEAKRALRQVQSLPGNQARNYYWCEAHAAWHLTHFRRGEYRARVRGEA